MARVNAALVVLFTLDGVPFLYNGQEVADAARHSIFGRLPIDWANGETPAGKARFAFCQKLCAMRLAETTLTRGDMVWLDNDHPNVVVSFLRRLGNEQIVCVVNLSNRKIEKMQIELPAAASASSRVLLNDRASVSTNGEKLSVDLGSFGYCVLATNVK
jgi:cyclomaltodextrinase / maltogenic alpha-amylase / neopullulanase